MFFYFFYYVDSNNIYKNYIYPRIFLDDEEKEYILNFTNTNILKFLNIHIFVIVCNIFVSIEFMHIF